MNEQTLKAQLVKELRFFLPNFVIIRHEDRITSGIPDISITGHKIGSWWEVKNANPKFASKGIQELMMLRLANSGFAYYVVYYDYQDVQRTYIVDPKDIKKPIDTWKVFVPGFDHRWIVLQVKDLHTFRSRT